MAEILNVLLEGTGRRLSNRLEGAIMGQQNKGQPRAIAASAFTGYFSPIHRFEKFEVHKVHLHFSNLVSTKNSSPNALAELCGAALCIFWWVFLHIGIEQGCGAFT